MKVLSSLKSAKTRHRDCKVVRRRGKVFVGFAMIPGLPVIPTTRGGGP
jgi:ribosomal protein L36